MAASRARQSRPRNTILIVDDDAKTREFLRIRLEGLKYRVAEAEDKDHALRTLKKRRSELVAVFLDLYLRAGSDAGFAALDAMVSMAPEVPVIVYSAKGIEGAAEAVQRGAFWFIDKVEASDEEFAAVLMSVLRTWELTGRILHAEAQRDFLQRLIDSIPLEIMARDKSCYVHLENKAKSRRFGGALRQAEKAKCTSRYDPACETRPDREVWCVCEAAFRSGRPESCYYTWQGKVQKKIKGAELLITAAPMGKSLDGKRELVVETARDVSRQVGYLALTHEIARLGRTDRMGILEAVVQHFVGRQDRGPLDQPGSQANIGFVTARAYLVEPRGSQEVLRLRAWAGEGYPDTFEPGKVVFRRNRTDEIPNPIIGRLWASPGEIHIISPEDFRGPEGNRSWRIEKEPYMMTGEAQAKLWIPIRVGSLLEGVIVADKRGRRDPKGNVDEGMDWEDLHWARAFARYLSEVFENIYRLESAQWLLDTERALAQAPSILEMYERLTKQTRLHFGADVVQVHSLQETGRLVMVAGAGHAQKCPLWTHGTPTDIGVIGRACRGRQAQYVPDARSDEDFRKFREAFADAARDCPLHDESHEPQSLAVVPFEARGEVVGALCLLFNTKRSFDAVDQSILRSLGAGLSMALPAVQASVALEERLGALVGLRELYKAAATAASEAELVRHCLTHLTAEEGMKFNRALFFAARDGEFRCQDAMQQFPDDGSGPVGRTVQEGPGSPSTLQTRLVSAGHVSASALGEICASANTPLAEAMRNPEVAVFHTDIPNGSSQAWANALASIGISHFLVVGVLINGGPLGAFVVSRPVAEGLTQLDRQELRAFGLEVGQLFAQLVHKQQEELALLGRVSAFVGHDLIQPLAAMAASLETLRTMPEAANLGPFQERLAALEQRRQQAIEMVSALREFCSGTPEKVNPARVVRAALILIVEQANLANVVINDTGISEAVSEFWGYPGALVRGITNLLQNSVDAIAMRRRVDTPWHGGTVYASVREGPGGILISIRDDGVGMGPEAVQRLHSPRGWGSATQSGRLGLGFEVARRAAERNNGSISVVYSEPLGGTEVAICIPPRSAPLKTGGA